MSLTFFQIFVKLQFNSIFLIVFIVFSVFLYFTFIDIVDIVLLIYFHFSILAVCFEIAIQHLLLLNF